MNLNIIQQKLPKTASPIIIAEIDGGMLPLVEIQDDFEGDKRKTRRTFWAENRLCLAYAKLQSILKVQHFIKDSI